MFKAVMIVLALAMIILSGCATDVVDHSTPVDIPVSTPCRITPPKTPNFATQGVTASTPLFEQVRALIAADAQHTGYEDTLVSAVSACQ